MGREVTGSTVDYDHTINYNYNYNDVATHDDDDDDLRYRDLMNNLTESSLKLRHEWSAYAAKGDRGGGNTGGLPSEYPGSFKQINPSRTSRVDKAKAEIVDVVDKKVLARVDAVQQQNETLLGQLALHDAETRAATTTLVKLDLLIGADPKQTTPATYEDYLHLERQYNELKQQYISELDKSHMLMKSFQKLSERLQPQQPLSEPVSSRKILVSARLLKAKEMLHAVCDSNTADDIIKQRCITALQEIKDAESILATVAGDR